MDKILKTLYLRVDSTTKSLTKNAFYQLIIKILYASSKSLSKDDICQECCKLMKCKGIEDLVDSLINKLLEESQIKCSSGRYYLSSSKRRKIDVSYNESELRLTRIVEKYFKPSMSDDDNIKGWLTDALITFFSDYSSEWIADISFKKSSAITGSKYNIISSIEKNTLNDSRLILSDRNDFCEKFIIFITSKDSDVDALMWEFGTSAFSAKIINASLGADELVIQAFSDSMCVLDTNVLMNIGLESSDYYSALKSLEQVFKKLNIIPGYLHITQEEYKRTIGNKADEIISIVEKFPYNVIKETSDTYVQTAIKRGCVHVEDFQEFFRQVSKLPSYIEDDVSISLFDSDKELENAIIRDQTDEKKNNELNSIFKSFTGKDKRQSALIHDVGLIAGANYLRERQKCFILSQEISVNQYAKEKPLINNLPLSIRLETLINMLAIDNGGIEINPQDYTYLFASIIKNGLVPNKDIFKIADLSRMQETEIQISQLPPDDIIRIAKDVHRNRLIGLEEEQIGLELSRNFQEAKLKIVDDLQQTLTLLDSAEREKNRYQSQANKSMEALRKQFEIEEDTKVRKNIRNQRLFYYLAIPLTVLLITLFLLFCISDNSIITKNGLLYGIIIDLVIFGLSSFFLAMPNIRKTINEKASTVEEKVRIRLEKEQIN